MTRGRRLAGWANLVVAGVLMLAVWLLLVLLASRPALKRLLDFSPQATGSISPVTEELLAEIRREELAVELHTFFPPLGSPPQNNEEARHQWGILNRLQNLTYDLLRQYGYFGGEAVRVVHHDLTSTRNMARTREAAERFNFRGDEGSTVVVVVEGRHKKLSMDGDMAVIEYPGLNPGANVPGPRNTLPLLKDFKGEEAVSSAIKALLTQGTPVVCFLTGFGEASLDDAATTLGYGQFAQGLRSEGFELREHKLAETGGVPEDATVVALLEPKVDITARDARALYDYVKRGGRLFINFSYQGIPGRDPTFEELGRLLGFSVSSQVVFHYAPTNTPSSPWRDGVREVQQLDVRSMALNHPITKPLLRDGRVPSFAAARELRRREDVPEGVRPDASLLMTGPYAWLASWPLGAPPDFNAPRDAQAFQNRSLGMVIDVDGAEQGTEGHVVLLGGLAINNVGYPINRDLGLNIFNWLAERKALVTVRGKSYRATYLEVGPDQIDNMTLLLVAGWPGGVLLLGLFVLWRRRRI